MKKISLKNLHLKEVEQLSREQLKNVLGGWTGGTGETDAGTTETEPPYDCSCSCNNVLGSWIQQGNCIDGYSYYCAKPGEPTGPYRCRSISNH